MYETIPENPYKDDVGPRKSQTRLRSVFTPTLKDRLMQIAFFIAFLVFIAASVAAMLDCVYC